MSIEAQARLTLVDRAASGNVAAYLIRNNDEARVTTDDIPTGRYAVSVSARGQYYRGWPNMLVNFRGNQLGDVIKIQSDRWVDIDLGVLAIERGDDLAFAFTNDAWGGTRYLDRNLLIDTVSFSPVEVQKTVAFEAQGRININDRSASADAAAFLIRPQDEATVDLGDIVPGRYALTVSARGQYYIGWPTMRATLDGSTIADAVSVRDSRWTDINIGTFEIGQGQRIAFYFTNDAWGGSSDRDRNLFIDTVTLTPVRPGEEIAAVTDPTLAPADYATNLALIRAVDPRNTTADSSPHRNTSSSALPVDELLGPRAPYVANHELAFKGVHSGSFRAGCEFSHFAYDDPIVFNGKPGAGHLHMFFGNTDANAYSTFDTIINSGGSTCNGGELNRTAYWVPAMFDGEGNVRIPDDIIIYYKGYFDGIGAVQPYPENMQIVSDNSINTESSDTDVSSFRCYSEFGAIRTNKQNTIPTCAGGNVGNNGEQRLEMNVKFEQCWNSADPTNYQDNLAKTVSRWFSGVCPASHPILLPNLEVRVLYPVKAGEDTSAWFIASDVNHNDFSVGTPGASSHGDWWGGWHRQINQTWLDNCTNVKTAGCATGYLDDSGDYSDGPALRYRDDYTGPHKISAAVLFDQLCPYADRAIDTAAQAAYCLPHQ